MATSITVEEVCAVIGIAVPDDGTPDGVWMRQCVGSINALARDCVPRLRAGTSGESGSEDWPEDIRTGLIMWAQRQWARRSSPTGITGYSDSGATYVARWDPDVERLLRIGKWARPVVG